MQHSPKQRSDSKQIAVFAVAMALYLLVVHGWALKLPPGPGDLALFARTDPPWGPLLRWQLQTMGDTVWVWRSFQLLLLYGCMLAIFFLTRFTVGKPWWLGSFAAVLFMAHPAKSEAVLDLAGLLELFGALLALWTLALYAAHLHTRRWGMLVGALVLLLLSSTLFVQMLPLFLLLVLMELLLPHANAPHSMRLRLARLALGLGAFALTLAFWHGIEPEFVWSPAALFAPLHATVYPVGLLPTTVQTYEAHPWLGWAVAGVAVLLVLALFRGIRHPALLWGVSAAAAARLLQVEPEVDPVTLAGGGGLLLPIALVHIAYAAACQGIVQRHPHWGRPIVDLTTIWCVLYFILQIQVILQWR